MKQKIFSFIVAGVVTAGALVLTATDGFSFGSLGDDVDAICAPDTPFTDNGCALCHTSNRGEATPAKEAYLAGGTTLTDYFCPDPVISYSLPRNVNIAPMGSADFNGDNNPDVLLRNTQNGVWFMNLMQGETILLSTKIPLIYIFDWELAGIGDFNGDGNADILLNNPVEGRWLMYMMDGVSVLLKSPVGLGMDPDMEIGGIDDFDGDGNADILLRNTVTGRWFLHLMDGATVLQRTKIN